MGPRSQPVQNKGGKRKADQATHWKQGDPKRRRHGESKNGHKSGEKRAGGSASASDMRDALLDEIRALGGHESDLDFLDGVSSDSAVEFEGSGTSVPEELRTKLDQLSSTNPSTGAEIEELDAPMKGPPKPTRPQRKDGRASNMAPPTSWKKTIVEPRADWHAADLPDLPGPPGSSGSSDLLELVSDSIQALSASIDNLKGHARTLLDQDAAMYAESFRASSSHKFLATIMSSGTMTDKVSALTLAVQESPLHNVRAFDALLNLASKKSRSQAIIALAAIVDLLGPGLVLPANRRLKAFRHQPGLVGVLQRSSTSSWNHGDRLPRGLTAAHLVTWIYEDWLKGAYFKVIQLLETWCGDEIDYSRMRALDFVYGLLREKPEQESNLLKLLVNKLGDKERKLASRASYLLLQLQNAHPGMKSIIIHTMEQEVIFRPGQALRARYYAVNTLNQTILSSKEVLVADMLVRLYFAMFSSMLRTGEMGSAAPAETRATAHPPGKRRKGAKHGTGSNTTNDGELAEKLVSAILTGVNRAASFVDRDDVSLESQLDTLFRIAHSSNFNTSIQALVLIQQLSSTRHVAVDRFYRTLYESLLDPRLSMSSKQAMYLNLLLRSLKNDNDVRRVKAFAKRMLQVLALHQPSFACGVLYILSQLNHTFPALATLTEEPEEAFDGDEEGQHKHSYDGRKRDPEYSNAHRTCLWEIVPALNHFHPSVLVYAASVVDPDKKTQKPDLESHSLIRFLDKLSYRNPKAKELSRGSSIMQPLQIGNNGSDSWLRSKSSLHSAGTGTVNSAAFWSRKPEDVSAEDVFFHEYFAQSGKANQPGKTAKAPSSNVDSDEGGDIWQALTGGDVGDEADEDDLGLVMDDGDGSDSGGSMPNWDSDDACDQSIDGALLEDEDAEEDEADGDADADADATTAAGGDAPDLARNSRGRERKKRLRDLPTFASVDDYAHLLGAEEEV